MENKCPVFIQLIVWLYIGMLSLILVFGVIYADGQLDIAGIGLTAGKWLQRLMICAFVAVGLLLMLQVLKGRMWAYYILLGILSLDVISQVSNLIRGNYAVFNAVFGPGLLLLALWGFDDYRDFTRERKAIADKN